MRFIICSALVLACALMTDAALAQTVEFENNWGDPGFTVAGQSPSGLEIVYSVPRIQIGSIEVDGEILATIGMPGVILPNNPGAPNLPGMGRFIAVPQGATYSVEIIRSSTRIFENLDICPAAPLPRENDDSPAVYEKDPAIYSRDAVYPAQPVMASEPMKLRGVDSFILGITPFAYNPVQKTLTVFTNLRIRVTFHGGTGHIGDDSLRNRWFEPMLEQHLLNYSSLPAVNLNRPSAARGEECEYMIFVPDNPDYISWAKVIRDFRVKQGISTNIFNIADIGGTASAIEAKINDAYANWSTKPVAALMLGDLPMMPALRWNGYCLSDNLLADIDGDDLPEINIARMTARDAADLNLLINKFIDYETNPPTNPSFYDEPIMAGGWQTERWFILCTEVCYGYLTNVQGKHPVREYAIYYGTPTTWSTNQNTYMILDYFGPNGLGYIPATPAHLTDWGANAARINADINKGAFYMLHRDHGSNTGWGEPDYDINDLSGLSNQDLCFVMSINCLTGEYDYNPECFSEVFHRMTNGALGLLAASEVSYSFVNDTYIWGLHDSMWPDFDPGYGGSTGDHMLLPGFANASGKWYLQASSWPYNTSNKDETQHLFHLHGDAFTQLYSEVPQNLTVSHAGSIDNTATTFVVTADAGSLIALSLDDKVLGTATGTGAPVTIYIDPPGNPGIMYVTVTKLNHYRYEGQVVVQTGGPLAIWLPEDPPSSVFPGPATDVDVMIMDGVQTYVPGSGKVHYRFDPADPFSSAALTSLGGDLYNACIPGAPPNSRPEFYVSAEGNGGATVYSPPDAPATTYGYGLLGLPMIVMHDNFETDTGWTVQDYNITTGTWERCDPNTTSGEQVAPVDDNPATGTLCYVTDNGPAGATYSDYDIDGGPTVLTSPTLDLSGVDDPQVTVYVWYYARDGDDPFYIDVSNDNGSTWTNAYTTMTSLSGWTRMNFTVADFVTPTSQVKVRFSAQDNPNDSITEAGVDDFMIECTLMSPSIYAGAYAFSASTAGVIDLYLDAGTAFAGREYMVAGTISGIHPGTKLPGGKVIPLNRDSVTNYILNHLNAPMFQNFKANLDGEGKGTATLDTQGALNPLYIGKTLSFAFTLTQTYDFVSTPVSIEIEP